MSTTTLTPEFAQLQTNIWAMVEKKHPQKCSPESRRILKQAIQSLQELEEFTATFKQAHDSFAKVQQQLPFDSATLVSCRTKFKECISSSKNVLGTKGSLEEAMAIFEDIPELKAVLEHSIDGLKAVLEMGDVFGRTLTCLEHRLELGALLERTDSRMRSSQSFTPDQLRGSFIGLRLWLGFWAWLGLWLYR
ncbi:hypothetical protein BJY04DRAFT_202491 [Aspergillus karnatakaensis]|uniref:uncharacterized protein n=1 Tax=Aspergillus karnatakaensis TaxID=1810916 RepID=UPI003CCDE7C8